MDALVTGHDNHLLKINDRETQLVARVSAWKVSLIKEVGNWNYLNAGNTIYIFIRMTNLSSISHSLDIAFLFLFCLYGLLQIRDNELKRNCLGIKDILRYVDHARGQLEEFQ